MIITNRVSNGSKVLTALAAPVAALLLLSTSVARGDADPRQTDPGQTDPRQNDELPTDVTLRAIAYAGTGCPAGSLRGEMPIDGKDFLIFWNAFGAAAGPGIPLRDSRKNCQLNLELDYPEGWQYAVESLDYSGTLSLEDGVQATVASAYYFQGSADTARVETDFAGPDEGPYQVVATYGLGTDDESLTWSPCDLRRSLNVNVQVRVSAGGQNAYGAIAFANDPETAGSLLVLKWRRC